MTLEQFLSGKSGTPEELLSQARSYPEVIYKKISASKARQALLKLGAYESIENASQDATLVTLANSNQVTLGSICRVVLDTMRYDGFTVDPTTEEGQFNIATAGILVSNGVVTQVQVDNFLDEGKNTVYPFKNVSLADIKRVLGVMEYRQVTPLKGWLKITATSSCERHNPQVLAEVQGIKKRVASFVGVSDVGEYLVEVNPRYSTLFVENAYGVII